MPNRKTIALLAATAWLAGCGGTKKDTSGAEQGSPSGAGETESAAAAAEPAYFRISDDKGTLERPTGYREWVFIGEPTTPNELNQGKAPFPEFHTVYIDPGSYAHWKDTGEFRDGTIVMKELVSVGSRSAVSGNGYFMGDFIGLEAAIKSSKHFPDEPGNWAYYSFTNEKGGRLKKTAEPFPTAACNACHDASADTDFVFTQYYPVLRGASTEEAAASEQPWTMDGDELVRPSGYRSWVFVGEPVTPNSLNNGKAPFPEFHDVYIDPESYAHLRKTGEFRDGTILIKELVSVGDTSAVSGKGFFMGEFIGLEAAVKSKAKFPDEPGNWAYFSFTTEGGGPTKPRATAFPTSACNTCHENSADTDYVFTQYYPVLRAAMAEAAGKPIETNNQWQPTGPTPEAVAGVPLDRDGLFAWLKSGAYKRFPAREKGTHQGRGPHTTVGAPVRAFYNQPLAASFKAGKTEHPKGSIIVKEMHGAGGLAGWAVMAKTADDTAGGKGWFWYEVTSIGDVDAVPAIGNGVPGCIGCHAVGGTDMVLSGWPLQ